MKKVIKDGLLIMLATLIGLGQCLLTIVVIYTFIDLTGLYAIGESLIFQIGLAILQVGVTGLCIEELTLKWIHPDEYEERHAFDKF